MISSLCAHGTIIIDMSVVNDVPPFGMLIEIIIRYTVDKLFILIMDQ